MALCRVSKRRRDLDRRLAFDEDLNQAMKIAVDQTVNGLSTQPTLPMSREEACALTSIVGDCRVSQVVDIRKGVHSIPKAIFHRRPPTSSK
jgi:acetamidase/formamidase